DVSSSRLRELREFVDNSSPTARLPDAVDMVWRRRGGDEARDPIVDVQLCAADRLESRYDVMRLQTFKHHVSGDRRTIVVKRLDCDPGLARCRFREIRANEVNG